MNYEKAYKDLMRDIDISIEGQKEGETKIVLQNLKERNMESEDERIRKALIGFVEQYVSIAENREGMLAYLEKQKEQKPKQEPKWLYRLEFKDKSCGLWYNGKGEWCFESGIGSLDDSCKTKTLPMDYDERYKADGRDWFSSCSRKEDLLHWYSKEDARILLRKGFVFTRYLATEYTEYEQQTVFIKETALYREEIDFFSLFNEQQPAEWNEEDERHKEAIIECIRLVMMECTDSESIEKYENDINWLNNRLKSFRPYRLTPIQKTAISRAMFLASEANEDGLVEELKKIYDNTECVEPIPHWKPSEEQMKALGAAIVFHKTDPFVEMWQSLYDDLQKLR